MSDINYFGRRITEMRMCHECMKAVAIGTGNRLLDFDTPLSDQKCDMCGKSGLTVRCMIEVKDW